MSFLETRLLRCQKSQTTLNLIYFYEFEHAACAQHYTERLCKYTIDIKIYIKLLEYVYNRY